MLQRTVTILNRLGMHARASATFVTAASRYGCRVEVSKEGVRVDGKSIMSIMMLAAAKGERVTISCEGPDAEEALDALTRLIGGKFGEEVARL